MSNNPNFSGVYSTWNIWRAGEMEQCLEDDLVAIETNLAEKADSTHTHTGYAAVNHTHNEYVSADHMHTDYASVDHMHDEYSLINHVHTGYATESYVDAAVASVVESAPETLNTLNELAAALDDDPNFATTIANQIGTKVAAVEGKGLSTNDLTDALKTNYDAAYTHLSNKANPHGVTLSQLGVNATAAELNYVDGVTSSIQAQLNNKATSDHTHSGYAASNHIHDYAASSHNHSASNITSGTLAVGRGGTGSTAATKNVTINRGADAGTGSSAFGYTCQYVPYLNMCFVRIYVQPKEAWSADTDYEVGIIGNSTYYPASMMALSNYAQKEVSTYINTEGKIVVRPYENVGTNYGVRIAGFWFCE